MIFRTNLFKISENLCKYHSKLFRRINFFGDNRYLVNYYSNKSNNNNNNCDNFWSEFDFMKYNQNNDRKDVNLKDIYKFQESDDATLRLFSSSSMSMSEKNRCNRWPIDEMQTQSSHNLIAFDDQFRDSRDTDSKGDSTHNRNDWFDIVSKAEQVVKYPTSFLSLRFLLKDEISYLAIHLKRLIDTKHPLLKTAKTILSTNQQIRGLVVLLLSKAYSVPKHILDNYDSEVNRLTQINKCQRKLAEITDMIHVSQVLHKGIVDLKVSQSNEDMDHHLKEDLHLGNTISLLIGDFLLAHSSRGLALIRNPTITGSIAEGFGNYSEAEFLRSDLFENQKSLEVLEKYCYLSGGSLMAHSCRSAILLAHYDQQIQNEAFLIGKYIGTAFQLSDLHYRQSVYDPKSDDFDVDLKAFDMNSIKLLLQTNVEKAFNLIRKLNSCDATKALIDIVLNIENIQNINQIH